MPPFCREVMQSTVFHAKCAMALKCFGVAVHKEPSRKAQSARAQTIRMCFAVSLPEGFRRLRTNGCAVRWRSGKALSKGRSVCRHTAWMAGYRHEYQFIRPGMQTRAPRHIPLQRFLRLRESQAHSSLPQKRRPQSWLSLPEYRCV